ncbi:MAG: efflux RND transporter periplasmic adaptor subunit [Lysobacterales bacterium]
MSLKGWSGIIIAAVVALLAWWFWPWQAERQQGPGWRTTTVDRGPISVSVSATGTLKALSTVDVGTQVSGQVLQVLADFNDQVTAGQIIAIIDPANFQARLTQARADLASARAGLEEAQANHRNAEADYTRKTELNARQLVARSEVDLALAARDQARARVSSARASIAQRDAAVANAELDLTYTEIRAPVDGVVLLRQVEPGQTVAASFQTPVLFQIAEDLAQMQIELAVDESDVGQIRADLPVRFTVDAFPGRRFEGRVRQVRLAATNVANVITYPVVIDVDNADLSLLPGMTASATIEVARRNDVLRVANAALRFKPDGVEEPQQRMGGGMDLSAVAESLQLNPTQQAAFDADTEQLRQRMQERAAAGGWSGSQRPAGAAPAGASGGMDPAALAERIAGRILAGYANFMATLDAEQRQAFERGVQDTLKARRAFLWTLRDGQPEALPVRVGISDATHTEVSGRDLDAGLEVLSGQSR